MKFKDFYEKYLSEMTTSGDIATVDNKLNSSPVKKPKFCKVHKKKDCKVCSEKDS